MNAANLPKNNINVSIPTYIDKKMWISNHDEQSLGSSDGNIETFWVAKETKLMTEVKSH